jgi:Ni,Fe-hydrogenase I cytochrome b subunit
MSEQFIPIFGWLGLLVIFGCIFGTGYFIGRRHELNRLRRGR